MKLQTLQEVQSRKSEHIGGYTASMNQIEKLIDQAAKHYGLAFNASPEEIASQFEQEIQHMIRKALP